MLDGSSIVFHTQTRSELALLFMSSMGELLLLNIFHYYFAEARGQ
jgi:hypothetical protein